MVEESIFKEFLNEDIKATYRDGDQFRVARGRLIGIKNGFVKISGRLGIIIINENEIKKMARSK